MTQRLGIIDLGTNSARLLVADVSDAGGWSAVASHRIACRLGDGLAENGRIDPAAEERAARALMKLAEQAAVLGQVTLRVIATHAIRAARNGVEVQGRLEESLGMPLTVLSGEREAHLVLRAARQWRAPQQQNLVALDLGGGSLEFAVQPVHPDRDVQPQLTSLPLGAVVLSEGMPTGVVSTEHIDMLQQRVQKVLDEQAPSLAGVGHRVVGAGGTVVCAAAVLGFVPPWNGAVFTRDSLDDVITTLAAMNWSDRSAIPSIGDRADIIVPGMVVLRQALRHVEAQECVVLEHGVREGALLALADGEL